MLATATLTMLPQRRRPGPTACASCPVAVWYVLPRKVQCYCRVMHMEVYSSENPEERVEVCDGLLLSRLETG